MSRGLIDVLDDFLRIVLDEAHNIKNRTALVSKACYELKGQRRWALTGDSDDGHTWEKLTAHTKARLS